MLARVPQSVCCRKVHQLHQGLMFDRKWSAQPVMFQK